jgi:MFS family permease
LIGFSTVAAGAALVVFSVSPWIALSMAMMTIVGFGIIISGASINTIVQTIVEDGMRGRVMSFYTISFLGVAPLGAVTIGALAQATNVQIALGFGGLACVAFGSLFLKDLPRMRVALAAAMK